MKGDKFCYWMRDDDGEFIYFSECGHEFDLSIKDLKEGKYKTCPKCRKPIKFMNLWKSEDLEEWEK